VAAVASIPSHNGKATAPSSYYTIARYGQVTEAGIGAGDRSFPAPNGFFERDHAACRLAREKAVLAEETSSVMVRPRSL
jgi:hypothetical protein